MKSELDKVKDFIARQTWTFAKTMPLSPHEYVVKTKLSEDEQKEFERFVMFIREHGSKKRYKKSNYVHLDIDGNSYWTMGAPLEITTIINRHDLGFYDQLAGEYDKIFSDDESKIENEQIGRILAPAAGGNILDVGCGTGLLLDILPGEQHFKYHGIDPSRKMLDRLAAKHKAWNLTCATFEEFPAPKSYKYDLIVSLFGAVSYINPAHLKKIKKLLRRGGKYFLMFYRKGYFPLLYRRSGVCFSHYVTDAQIVKKHFGENTFEYSNYLVATNIKKR